MASVYIDDLEQRRSHANVPAALIDEDLSWILDVFVTGMVADGGAIIFRGDSVAPRALATTGVLDELSAMPAELLAAASAVAEASARRISAPDPLVVWCATKLGGGSAVAVMVPQACSRDEQIVAVAVYRTSPDSATCDAAAARLHPILAGFFPFWAKARAQSRATTGLEAALNSSACAVAMLHRSGEVRFLNRAMRRIADAGDGLRLRGRTLVASDLAGSMRLQVAMGQVLADSGVGRETSAITLFLDRPKRGGMLPVAVLATRFAPWELDDAMVIVHAVDPSGDLSEWARPVCHAHGLSPVESSLVLQLLGGATLMEAADAIHVKEQTARAYLKQIFAKTEIARQSELIRLMLTHSIRIESAQLCLRG